MADPTKKTNAELEELQEAARQRVAQEAEQAATLRTQQDATELAALNTTQGEEMSALKSNNQALYKNQQEIIDAAYAKIETAKQKDEKARKRENAFRYISGLGDTLSGVANLIGTAHGAANQQQKYNSHALVEKAEEARKARKLEMDDLSKRYDEMKSRLNELQAAGSLKEAQLAASHAKAVAALNKTHRTAAETADRFYANRSDDAAEEAARNYHKQQELDIEANKPPRTTTAKPKIVKILGEDGTMMDYDVSGFKNFDADYQRAFAAAIADGTSGLSDDEIKQYNDAARLASAEGDRALKEFFRTHTPRQSIIKRMGINNPRYR